MEILVTLIIFLSISILSLILILSHFYSKYKDLEKRSNQYFKMYLNLSIEKDKELMLKLAKIEQKEKQNVDKY